MVSGSLEDLMFRIKVGDSMLEYHASQVRRRVLTYARMELNEWERPTKTVRKRRGWTPDFGWKWGKWTFGFWHDPENHTLFGIDIGPLEIVWRYEGYRP